MDSSLASPSEPSVASPPRGEANAGLSCTVVTDASELARLEGPWSELLGRSATDEPTLSPRWARAWWQVFGDLDGRALRLALVRDGGRLVGVAPLLARAHWYGHALPFRRLELVCTGEPPEDEICSEYVGVVAERGAEAAVAEALASALARGAFGGWDELVLRAMDGEAPVLGALAESLRAQHLAVEIVTDGAAPIARLPPTWEGYLASLPSRHRYLVTRSLRDFERWSAGTGRIEPVRTADELDRARHLLVELHEARWSAAGAHGAFHSPRFRAFHDRVMPWLLAEGALDLSVLTAFGEPIGVLYDIAWRGKLTYYQSGRRTEVPDAIRPGIVMHAHAIRRAIAAGFREYDFLGGESRYKLQLANASRPIATLRAARPNFVERARLLGSREARVARGFVASVLARVVDAPEDDAGGGEPDDSGHA
jgi:CelD/BcsL family acetyltransferase involved in cellulose biosynthesis